VNDLRLDDRNTGDPIADCRQRQGWHLERERSEFPQMHWTALHDAAGCAFGKGFTYKHGTVHELGQADSESAHAVRSL
jgi:hypothetical protein